MYKNTISWTKRNIYKWFETVLVLDAPDTGRSTIHEFIKQTTSGKAHAAGVVARLIWGMASRK